MESHVTIRKCLVVSAVNFSEGGPLTVLIESLDTASSTLGPEWDVVALVHDAGLIKNPRVKCIAFPMSKASWFNRLKLEWWQFYELSKDLKPDLWLSLHDITPRVLAKRQVVYCHNPAPFYRIRLREIWFEPKFFLFNIFYSWIYRINIARNHTVIVQQEWLRQSFRKLFGHPNILVSHPHSETPMKRESAGNVRSDRTVFVYPALPRVFKNFEVLCRAAALLPDHIKAKVEIRLTISGNENRYAADLLRRFASEPALRFIGRQSRDDMAREYSACDAVLFPSKLETWGLPISEAKIWDKPLLVVSQPYARETVGNYAAVSFIRADDPQAWADAIGAMVQGNWLQDGHLASQPDEPFAHSWQSLWHVLIKGL